MVLIHISVMISEAESLLYTSRPFVYIFLSSVCSSLLLLNGLVFLLLICGSLYIMGKSPLSDMFTLNILSQSVACFFTFLMEDFDEEKLLILMNSNLSIFSPF